MTFMSARSRYAALLLAGAAIVVTSPARAQEDVVNKVKELNKKAIDAYENLELEEARKYLTQALEMCASEGLNNHSVKATSHVNLGIIFVGGFKQRDQGVRQFRRALEIDPSLKIPKRLQNPEINAAFDEAKAGLGSAEGKPPVAVTPPVAPAPTPPAPVAAATGGDAPPAAIKGIYHQPVTDADPGATITIKASVEAAMKPAKVILAYRAEGASDFLQRDMEPNQGWLTARIPQAATNGGSVSYYIEARDKSGRAIATNGSAADPHVITLGGSGAEAKAGDEPGGGTSRRSGGSGGGAGKIWVGFAVGAGGGYTKGHPEVNATDPSGKPIDFNGVANAQLMHFAPEIGYALRDDLVLSLQGRLQIMTGATKIKCNTTGETVCDAATGAVAVFGRATYLLSPLGPVRPTIGGILGAGQIRHLIDVSNRVKDPSGNDLCGDHFDSPCFDSVVSKTVMIGPSLGLLFPITDLLSLTAGLNAVFIVPTGSFNVDLNLGVAAAF